VARTDATISAARTINVRGGRLTIKVERGPPPVVIGSEPVIVGRDASCHVVIPDRHVSAVHAELVATERGVRVRDLGSRNGTWASDIALVESYFSKSAKLSFGGIEAKLEILGPEKVVLGATERIGGLFGENPAMRRLFTQIDKVAKTDLTVLIQGETGTGKELVAHAIHTESDRRSKPFVVVDCGALSPGLAESILFGHEKGAFTNAIARRDSPFLQAAGGTVFLDELGELPIELQPKLLRALAEHRVQSVGGTGYASFDARIVAATRRDLTAAINDNLFRSDLYFRVAQVRLEVPPLRARADDLPGLIREFLVAAGEPEAMSRVAPETMIRLLRHDWPGNVRELRNAVAVAHALAGPDDPIDVAAHIGLPDAGSSAGATTLSYHAAKREALSRFERGYFSMLLQECNSSVVEVSRRSGLQRTHVRKYLKQHGLHPASRRSEAADDDA
jgi:DNA-binding NtrC family response regulator